MSGAAYAVAPEVFAAHPGYRRGVLVLEGLDNTASSASLAPLLRSAEGQAREQVTGNVAEHPRVAAWREAYRRFGAKPSEHRSAIEALLRRVLKPDALPSINPLVDLGNVLSLRHLLPVGVHPLPSTGGGASMVLRPAVAGDTFAPPDDGPVETPPPGEIVLARGHEVLTRRWTWRQAAGTRIEPSTTRVFVNVDGLPPVSADELRTAMDEAGRLLVGHVGGFVVASAVLAASSPSMAW